VDALPQLISKDVVEIFEKYKVLTSRELHARYDVLMEQYNKTVNIEGQLMVLLANRYLLPAALEYQKRVAESVSASERPARSRSRARRLSTRSPG